MGTVVVVVVCIASVELSFVIMQLVHDQNSFLFSFAVSHFQVLISENAHRFSFI